MVQLQQLWDNWKGIPLSPPRSPFTLFFLFLIILYQVQLSRVWLGECGRDRWGMLQSKQIHMIPYLYIRI